MKLNTQSVALFSTTYALVLTTFLLLYSNEPPEIPAPVPISASECPTVFEDSSADRTCRPGSRSCVYDDDDVDFRVVVITFNRNESLLKLLRTLDSVEMDGDRAALEIWIDRNEDGLVDLATLTVANFFNWTRGRTRVHVQEKHVGIAGQWIDTWRPRRDGREIGLILEDDISVSPFIYRWLKAVHRAYGPRTDFAGASLTSDQMSILSESPKGPLAAPASDTVLMYKCFGTWGFSPKPEHWRHFQEWFHSHKSSVKPHFRPYVPNASPTTWYKEYEVSGETDSMWEMWFIHYMHIEQLYAVYNNLGVYTGNKESCLCINRREVGLHVPEKGPEDLCKLLTTWNDDFVYFPLVTVRLDWDGTPMGSSFY